jgi:hypothetical protein
MPQDAPPSYHAAVQQNTNAPSLNVTGTNGVTHRQNSVPSVPQHQGLERVASNESYMSDSTDGGLHASHVPDDDRMSMDDEFRELPKGWVRCFDPK